MIKIKFQSNITDFDNDYMDIIRAFFPYVSVEENAQTLSLNLDKISEYVYNCTIFYEDKKYNKQFEIDKNFLEEKSDECYDIKFKAQLKRYSKIALYEFLEQLTGQALPYGSLTGIRPTKLYHELLQKGYDANDYFLNTLKVSQEKTKLIELIADNQKAYYNVPNNQVDVFINIPICVSRCVYCSFISAQLDKVKKLVDPYCDLLLREIETTKEIIANNGLSVGAVYIGGGTPTSIDDKNFERIISACQFGCKEYTVEAGRPDTITPEKLKIMADNGVSRISVNPQTFNQKTLDVIGRKHTVKQIYDIYQEARKYDFDINMDLIAMLPEETFEDFCYSVDRAIELNPDNITIHTLSLKKGSTLKVEGYDNSDNIIANRMVDYGKNRVMENGYLPYYMYKQKYMSGNLENVGYCKKDKECVYNIHIMEEISSIIANGAGAISKRIFDKNRLERLANPKGLDVYLQREEKILLDKKEFFKN